MKDYFGINREEVLMNLGQPYQTLAMKTGRIDVFLKEAITVEYDKIDKVIEVSKFPKIKITRFPRP